MIIKREIPELYAQEEVEDPLVYVSVKIGESFWLITEYNPKEKTAFGFAQMFEGGGELGYIHIPELEEAYKSFGGEVINYDIPKPMSELKRAFCGA